MKEVMYVTVNSTGCFVFFSFLCLYCYKYKISNLVTKNEWNSNQPAFFVCDDERSLLFYVVNLSGFRVTNTKCVK